MQDWVIIGRIGLATLLGAAIGFQREWTGKEAGLRTNMLISLGAALLTVLSIYAFPGDVPGRVAAGIVAGIGFIGAGVILHRHGGEVVGLTTAATIWVVAGIGMAAGAGKYYLAVAATALVIFTLFLPHLKKPAGGDTDNQKQNTSGEKKP